MTIQFKLMLVYKVIRKKKSFQLVLKRNHYIFCAEEFLLLFFFSLQRILLASHINVLAGFALKFCIRGLECLPASLFCERTDESVKMA